MTCRVAAALMSARQGYLRPEEEQRLLSPGLGAQGSMLPALMFMERSSIMEACNSMCSNDASYWHHETIPKCFAMLEA